MDSSTITRSGSFFSPMIVGGILIILVVIAIAAFLYKSSKYSESFENDENDTCYGLDSVASGSSDKIPSAAEEGDNSSSQIINEEDTALGNTVPNDCFPHKVLDSKDLLPSEANTKWAQSNPSGQGSLSDKNFLNAGFHIGMNTVGQSLRNSNLQLRSEPPNPQTKVSPWLQSTIDPDLNRKPLEIGPDA